MGVLVKVITFGLLTLGLASWVVFLAGTATLHKFFADVRFIPFLTLCSLPVFVAICAGRCGRPACLPI